MGLPSSNLASPLFGASPTINPSAEWGNALPALGQAQASPLSNLVAAASRMGPLNPAHMPPFSDGEIDAIRGRIGRIGRIGWNGQQGFGGRLLGY